jgi:cytochrome c oxidase subunit 2
VSSIRSTPRERGNEARRDAGGTARRSKRWAPLAVLLAGLVIVTTGCTSNAFTRMGLPVPVTKQGIVVVSMWQGSWIAAWAVGIVVWGGILWAIIFHRKRSNQQLPQQVRYNLPIEILYTVLPFIMVGVLFYFTARDENFIDKLPPHPQVVVNVTGFQWSWEFQYPQYQVTGGGSQKIVTETGAMWSPTAKVQNLPLLEIPTGETVKFNLTSIDVIHAFWVVPFEFKRDVIPGYANHFAVTATKTGSFIGRCTELCGVYHSRMLFKIKIVPPAKFRQWIHAQQAQESSSGGVQ